MLPDRLRASLLLEKSAFVLFMARSEVLKALVASYLDGYIVTLPPCKRDYILLSSNAFYFLYFNCFN